MNAAITQLEIYLSTLENNEQVNRKEGNEEQADQEAINASQVRQSLAILRAAYGGPIWPLPEDNWSTFYEGGKIYWKNSKTGEVHPHKEVKRVRLSDVAKLEPNE